MIKNKNIVITGASSGIGKQVCLNLCETNKILAVARRDELIPERSNIIKLKCDVSKKENIDFLFSEAEKQLGKIDIFIANAGFAYFETSQEPDWEHAYDIFATNVFSVIYSINKLKKIKGEEGFNFAVTASAMSFMAIPGYSLYASTKYALKGFADAFRFELCDNQIVSLIYPVATYTEFFDTADSNKIPWPRQKAKTVAKSIIKGIEKNKKNIFPSKLFMLGMFLNRFFPFFSMYRFIEGKKLRKLNSK